MLTIITKYGKRALCLISLIACFNSVTLAQPGFQKSIGMEGFEKGSSIKLLPNGNYIITGETESFGLQERDMLLMETDNSGNVLWSRSYGGPEREVVNDVVQLKDKGLLAIAEKYQPNRQEGEFLTLIKTNPQGITQWKKIIDEGGNETEGFAIEPTPDGAFVIAGMMKNLSLVSNTFFTMRGEAQHLYLLKVDEHGNKIWSRRYDSGISENVSTTGTAVAVGKDGSYILAGNIAKQGKTDKKIERPAQDVNMQDVRNALLIKVKPNGKLDWVKEYKANRITAAYAVIEKAEGGYILSGNTNVSDDNLDIFVMNLDETGNLIWGKTYGGSGFESLADVIEAPDGGFVVSCMTESYGHGSTDALIFKINKAGNVEWSKAFGGKNADYPSRIAPAENGFVMVGSTASGKGRSFDVLLMKLDWTGNGNCEGMDVKVVEMGFTPTAVKTGGAKMAEVEQGIVPPNYKKASSENIVEHRREALVRDMCE